MNVSCYRSPSMPRQWRYRLGKLVATCPGCGRRTFKPYLRADGSVLHPTVGRCNREIKCAYHLPPREYFAQNPLISDHLNNLTINNLTKNNKPAMEEYNEKNDTPLYYEFPDFIKPEVVKASQTSKLWHCPLREFFEKRFPADTIGVFRLYEMGISNQFGGAPIFWLLDESGHARTGKIMAYDYNGHRRKDIKNAVMWVHRSANIETEQVYSIVPEHVQRKTFHLRTCFFGSHIANFPNTKVILVESEKTALYLACWMHKINREMYLRYVVLATGGASNLTSGKMSETDRFHRFLPLRGKDVILIPDCDATDAWKARIPELMLYCRSVRLLDIRPYCEGASDDVMDLLERRYLRAHPE